MSTTTAAIVPPKQAGMIPIQRMPEIRAVLMIVGTFFIPIFVPFFRSALHFIALFALVLFIANHHKRGPKFIESHDLTGKIAIVTGANTGIGRETALKLAQLGASVILACRSAERTSSALAQVKAAAKSGANVEFIRLDLQDFASVRSFVNEFQSKYSKLDLLINNAGVMMCPYELTKDGNENQFQSNHLSHFLLTLLLTPQLRASKSARVVFVASEANFMTQLGTIPEVIEQIQNSKTYDPSIAYGVSKLANIQCAYELNRRYGIAGLPINAFSVHPGVVDTELSRHLPKAAQALALPLTRIAYKTCVEGAQTSLFAALSSKASPGRYHVDSVQTSPSKWAYNEKQVTDLWRTSVAATNLPAEFDLPSQ